MRGADVDPVALEADEPPTLTPDAAAVLARIIRAYLEAPRTTNGRRNTRRLATDPIREADCRP